MINFNLDEGRVSSINITEDKLEIYITKWNGRNLVIVFKEYTRFYEYNSIGREISNFEIFNQSSLLEIERRELKKMDFDEEELNNLVHLRITGFSDLTLLDIIFNKSSIFTL